MTPCELLRELALASAAKIAERSLLLFFAAHGVVLEGCCVHAVILVVLLAEGRHRVALALVIFLGQLIVEILPLQLPIFPQLRSYHMAGRF